MPRSIYRHDIDKSAEYMSVGDSADVRFCYSPWSTRPVIRRIVQVVFEFRRRCYACNLHMKLAFHQEVSTPREDATWSGTLGATVCVHMARQSKQRGADRALKGETILKLEMAPVMAEMAFLTRPAMLPPP